MKVTYDTDDLMSVLLYLQDKEAPQHSRIDQLMVFGNAMDDYIFTVLTCDSGFTRKPPVSLGEDELTDIVKLFARKCDEIGS